MVQPELGGYQYTVVVWTLLFLGSAAALVFTLLWFVRPTIRQRTFVALTGWITAGAAAHALFTVGAYPDQFAILFGPQSVYLTTWIVTGMVWSMMVTATSFERATGTDAQYVLSSGVGATLAVVAGVIMQGFGANLEGVLVTVGALFGSILASALAYVLLSYVYSKAVIETGLLGWLVIFGHTLDGATTAVAVDSRGIPVSYQIGRQIVDFAATLPTQEYIGVGWLVVLARLVLSMVVVAGVAQLLGSYLQDNKWIGYCFLGIVIAFGLGPGFHHFLMLMVIS